MKPSCSLSLRRPGSRYRGKKLRRREEKDRMRVLPSRAFPCKSGKINFARAERWTPVNVRGADEVAPCDWLRICARADRAKNLDREVYVT